MSTVYGSKTLLLDRYVKVWRQVRYDDAMGGVLPRFEKIIDRYKVTISPAQTPERGRKEAGDEPVSNSYRAHGHRTLNGMTIKIGDRFHDAKNNRCYDVVGAQPKRPGLAYSAMISYDLKLLLDNCPQQAPTGYSESSGPAGPSGLQTMFIMRHMAGDEILDWEALPYFDGVVFNLQYDNAAQLAALADLVAAGRRWWRYYTILDYPYSAGAFGGLGPVAPATWFNWLRDNIQFMGTTTHRRMRVDDTVSLFAGTLNSGELRELIPWSTISVGERASIEATMVSLALAPGGIAIPASGIFGDQWWVDMRSDQFTSDLGHESGHGDTKESSPELTALPYSGAVGVYGNGGSWLDHGTATYALATELGSALAPSGRYVIKNGEHRQVNGFTLPKPWMFENAWNNNVDGNSQPERWASAKAGFATDPRNILSIRCEATPNALVGVPEALAHWQDVGAGWISFTDDESPQGIANREAAYAEAAAVLAARGWPNG